MFQGYQRLPQEWAFPDKIANNIDGFTGELVF